MATLAADAGPKPLTRPTNPRSTALRDALDIEVRRAAMLLANAWQGFDTAHIDAELAHRSPDILAAIQREQLGAVDATNVYLDAELGAAGYGSGTAVPAADYVGSSASGRPMAQLVDALGPVMKGRIGQGMAAADALVRGQAWTARVAGTEAHRISRDAVAASPRRDRRIAGYRRIAHAGACAWCLMLATRGVDNDVLYKSAATAGANVPYHEHCHCTAEAVIRALGAAA